MHCIRLYWSYNEVCWAAKLVSFTSQCAISSLMVGIEQMHSSMHGDMSTVGVSEIANKSFRLIRRSDKAVKLVWFLCWNKLVRVLCRAKKYHLWWLLSTDWSSNWLGPKPVTKAVCKIFEWKILISITRNSRVLHKKILHSLLPVQARTLLVALCND